VVVKSPDGRRVRLCDLQVGVGTKEEVWVMNYKSEEKFLDIVENCLKNNLCQTWREVIPDECINWEKPYRVDLIFYRDDLGFVGVEGKNINTLGSGGIIAGAVDQIERKYKCKTYFGGKIIDKWAVATPIETGCLLEEGKEVAQRTIVTFIRGFLKKRYDIDLLEYNEGSKWMTPRVTVGAMTKDLIKVGGENIYGK